jgi:rhamnogalacturonyl hydrolase YesR
MHLKDRDPEMIADLAPKLEKYLSMENIDRASAGMHWQPGIVPWRGRNVWWWCDALFMAPPALARMHALTGDARYLDVMDAMFWDTVDHLLDPEAGLCYQSETYFPDKKRSPSGKKIFWARANGWLYGGLIRTLDYLPEGDARRQRYIGLFRQLTGVIVPLQGDDGLWRSSVAEPDWFPNPESSGSGLFIYGLLAGINRGYLDRETYFPAALKGWKALNGMVGEEGKIGYAQPPGGSPAPAMFNHSEDYAQGIFLLAASEFYQLRFAGATPAQ